MSALLVLAGGGAAGALFGLITFLVFEWEWREPGKGSHRRFP